MEQIENNINSLDAEEMQLSMVALFRRKATKNEIKKGIYAMNVLVDAPLAMFKAGLFCNTLISGGIQALDVNFNPIRKKFDTIDASICLGLYAAAIVIEYISLYTQKGRIQEVIPRIREASEKGIFIYGSLMALMGLIFSRFDSDPNGHAMDTSKEGVILSMLMISFVLSILSGILMLDKTRMPLTAPALKTGSMIKSDKVRHALEHGRVFFIASGTLDLLVVNMRAWCSGGDFLPIWCGLPFNPIASYVAALITGVIGLSLFILTKKNESYHRRFILAALAITTVCWGNTFFAELGYTIELYQDYDKAMALHEPLWSVVLAFTLPFFMAFARVLQANERLQTERQIALSSEIQLTDLSNPGSENGSPKPLPLPERANSEPKAGKVSQLGMYAASTASSLGKQTRQAIASFGSLFYSTKPKESSSQSLQQAMLLDEPGRYLP